MMGKNLFLKMIFFSLLFHSFLFSAFFIGFPTKKSIPKKVYYIDLVEIKSGSGAGTKRGGSSPPSGLMRELTVKKPEEPKSSLRYPVKNPKKEPAKEKTVISKPEKSRSKREITTFDPTKRELTTGVGASSGYGEGSGEGEGGIPGFPFYYYIQILRDRVSSNWFKALVPPGVSGTYRVVIFFRIKKNGDVEELRIEESSGLEALDLSALRAVKFSIPFPPLPREYEEDYIGVHFQFEFRK
ncbi:MAG: energy transducer TonB [Candidatus Aminicenantia bacterium]